MIGFEHFLAGAATLWAGVIFGLRPARALSPVRAAARTVRGLGRSGLMSAGAVLAFGAGAEAQGEKDVPIARINKQFEIATKDFGDGTVMLTSRSDGADGATYATHQFDCDARTYAPLGESGNLPEEFPAPVSAQQTDAFGQDDAITPLAQHACAKHGRPLLEW